MSQVTRYKLWEKHQERQRDQEVKPLLSIMHINQELRENYINPDDAWANDSFCSAYQAYKGRIITLSRLIECAEEALDG